VAFGMEDFEPVLRALKQIKNPPHSWVGGQAVFVWANRYLTQDQIKSTGLRTPLKSKDGDLRASGPIVQFLAKELNGQVVSGRLKDPSGGNVWGLIIKLNQQPVVIDVLEKLPGVADSSEGYSIEIKAGTTDSSLTARVIDPVSLLLNKADVWKREKARQHSAANGEVQAGRNDKEHLGLLGQLLPLYFDELRRWQRKGVSTKLDVEKERTRLQQFMATNPELPSGIAELLHHAIRSSDPLHGTAATRSSHTPGTPLTASPLDTARVPKTEETPTPGKDKGRPKKSGRAD
jgi:hypothetical protein